MTNSSEIPGYGTYLKNLHSKPGASPEQLRQYLRKVSKSEIVASTRIAQGEANEVYEVSFENGMGVIIRIDSRSGKQFEGERWAISRCAELDLPVPEILSIDTYENSNTSCSVWIHRKIDGVPLSQATSKPKNLMILGHKCGEILKKLHTIETKGYGYIDNVGNGKFSSRKGEASEYFALKETLMDAAESHRLDETLILQVLTFVTDFIRDNEPTPCLMHNDYEPKHILVKGNVVAGILDFGEAASGDPMNDLVRFSMSDNILFDSFLNGYGDHDFERVMTYRLGFNLFVIAGCHRKGIESGVQYANRRLHKDIEHTGFHRGV